MEIKTCEQYVLNVLKEREKDLDALQMRHEAVCERLDVVTKQLDELKTLLKSIVKCDPVSSEEGVKWIRFESIWSSYDAEQFETLVNLLDIDPDAEEEDNE